MRALGKAFHKLALCAGCLIGVDAAPAHAQNVRQQLLPVQSMALTGTDILTGKQGAPIAIAGHLRVPEGEKLPAVILMHSIVGLDYAEGSLAQWSRVLNEAGIATFAIDGFTPRGAVNLPADGGKVVPITRLPDAYAALRVLAKSPLIDPKRIVVMGFSHGTAATVLSNVARFQKLYGSADVQFAAHISVYGFCMTTYRDDEDLTKPALLLHGTADDSLPIEQCREYSARMTKAGKNVRLIEYADAHHGFDLTRVKALFKNPQGLSLVKCRMVEGDGGVILSKETNQPFSLNDPCITRGTTAHYHEAATKKAHADVLAFLREIFDAK
jgi:dienelactone hydrolase